MPLTDHQMASRRRFIKFLAASPLFAGTSVAALAQNTAQPQRPSDPYVWAPRDYDHLIASPKEALDVFDFEPVMHKNVPPAHFGYMASGVDDDVTLARQSRRISEISAAAAPAGQCQQDRHDDGNSRPEILIADHHRSDRRA